MTTKENEPSVDGPKPDEAFGILGNKTRVQILRRLGMADNPVAFSELRQRVGMSHSGQFNYHLDELVGHFVQKTDSGYTLSRTGERVVTAVLSGTVTDDPVLERAQIGYACQLCGAPIETQYAEGRVEAFCTECSGLWGREREGESGYLGARILPPAGVRERTPDELYRVAWTWTMLEIFAMSVDICPHCSAPLETRVDVCENHDPGDDVCSMCDQRYAGGTQFRCRTCLFERSGTVPVAIAATRELLELLLSHGLNPVFPESIAAVQRVYSDFDEEILSTDPFNARYTFVVDADTLTLTVDENLSVVEVTEGTMAESA